MPHHRACHSAAIAVLAAATCITRAAHAQVSLGATIGVVQYDAGGDETYTTFGIQAKYYLHPSFRVGIVGSTAHIGNPLRTWTLEGTDERIWRFSGFAEAGWQPNDWASIYLRAAAGVFHSSGVIFNDEVLTDPFNGITDTDTGIAWGGGVGMEFEPFSRIRLMALGNIWQDHAYGGTGFDPELIFGLAVDL